MVAAAPATPAALVVLQGYVSIGPTSAACIGEPSCVKPGGHILLEFTRSSSLAMAWTDKRGHYRVLIQPGTWLVSATQGTSTKPGKIVVPRAPTATRNFKIDTGIR